MAEEKNELKEEDEDVVVENELVTLEDFVEHTKNFYDEKGMSLKDAYFVTKRVLDDLFDDVMSEEDEQVDDDLLEEGGEVEDEGTAESFVKTETPLPNEETKPEDKPKETEGEKVGD